MPALAPDLEIALLEAVRGEHVFHDLDVGGDVHGLGGKQLVELLFKALDERVHDLADLLLRGGDVFALDALLLEHRVGIEQLERRGKIVIHEFADFADALGLFADDAEDLRGDRLDLIDLRGDIPVGDSVVQFADQAQVAAELILLRGLLRLLGLGLGLRLGALRSGRAPGLPGRRGAGGGGISITPVAFIVVQNGKVRMMQINNYTSSADRAIAMIPELVDKLTELLETKKEDKSESEEKK